MKKKAMHGRDAYCVFCIMGNAINKMGGGSIVGQRSGYLLGWRRSEMDRLFGIVLS
jgi:hypothetical protein